MCYYFADCNRYGTSYYGQRIESYVGFRMVYLHLTSVHFKDEYQGLKVTYILTTNILKMVTYSV